GARPSKAFRGLSHLSPKGDAHMVDVSAEQETVREAVARAILRMKPTTLRVIRQGNAPKGDVLGVARTAGIMAAKRTPQLIPLCHPLRITGLDVAFSDDLRRGELTVEARVRTVDKTGVEMEADGGTARPGATVSAPEPAPESALAVYHGTEYLQMLKAANGGQAPELAERFGLGPGDNPVFPGLWDAARLCAAGSILAADLV